MPYDGDDFDVIVLGRFDDHHGNGDLTGELAAAKAVLLYANSITVESYRPAFLFTRMLNQIRTVKTRLGPPVADLNDAELADLWIGIMDEVRDRRPDLARHLAAMPNDPRMLLELPDILVELTQEHGPPDTASFFRTISEDAVQRWVGFKPDERTADAVGAIRDLNTLVDAGIVLLDPGPVNTLWAVPEAELPHEGTRVISRVLAHIYGPGGGRVPLFDERAVGLADPPAAVEDAAQAHALSKADQVRVAARLLGGLPDLAHLPVGELLDLREEVAPQVARFRAAVAELEGALDADLRAADLDAAIAEVRKLRVEPELEALNDTLRENRLLPTMARAVPLTGSGVVGLAVTTLAGAPTLAAAAAVAVGATAAAANEYLRRQAKDAERKKNGLFLLHRAARAAER